jgi:hypothetical protein
MSVDVRLPEGTTEEDIKKLGLSPVRENILFRVLGGETLEEIHETVQGRDLADLRMIVGDGILALQKKTTGNGGHEQTTVLIEEGAESGATEAALEDVKANVGAGGDESLKPKLSEVTVEKLVEIGFRPLEAQVIFLRISGMDSAKMCEELKLKKEVVSVALARGTKKLRSYEFDLSGTQFEKTSARNTRNPMPKGLGKKKFPKCSEEQLDKINLTEEERKIAVQRLGYGIDRKKHSDKEISKILNIRRRKVIELSLSAVEKIIKGEEIPAPPSPTKKDKEKTVTTDNAKKTEEKTSSPATSDEDAFVEAEAVRDFAAKMIEAEGMKKQIQAEACETLAVKIGGMDPKAVVSWITELLFPYVASMLPGQGENRALTKFKKPREMKDASEGGG